jgi:hypothetical protein
MLVALVVSAHFFLLGAPAAREISMQKQAAIAGMPPKAPKTRTGNRQPIVSEDKLRDAHLPFYLKIGYGAIGKPATQTARSDRKDGYNRRWATRDEAEAAKPDFKKWVDEGMHPHARAAQAASSSSTARAASADAPPPVATRFSRRLNKSGWLTRVGLKLFTGTRTVGSMVGALLMVTRFAPQQGEIVNAWRDRSVDYRKLARERRACAVDLESFEVWFALHAGAYRNSLYMLTDWTALYTFSEFFALPSL